MNEELETLCQVQKIDTKIIENEKKRAIGPQRIEEMQTELTRTREKIAKEKEIVEEAEKERRKKEIEYLKPKRRRSRRSKRSSTK